MKNKFVAKDFDEVVFIVSGNETNEIIEAKEYLKDIQMTVNIGDFNESLFTIEDTSNIQDEEKVLFDTFKESIFSSVSLAFLEKAKLLTSFEGINPKLLEEGSFGTEDNFIYLNKNLRNNCLEFITAIWDCCLVLKISHLKNEKSILVDEFNNLFANLTKIKTGNPTLYVKKENNLDMICELVLFMQYYIPDFFIFLMKSKSDISSKKSLVKSNKEFISILKKSKKIAHRLQMLEQIKSNNYQLLLKLLIEQKNTEL